jgi:hypothetical protein
MSYDQDDEDALWRAAMRDGAAQAAGISLANYERSVITHVLKAAGITNGLSMLAARAREEIGESTINLRLFNAYASFPVRLVAAKLKLIEMPMADVFKRPTVTPIHQAYIEAVQEYPEEQSLVLVFRWRTFGERMVLHTLPREFGEPGKASRTKLVYAVGRAKLPPMIYTIEDLDGLLEALGWVKPHEERVVRLPRNEDLRRRRRIGSRGQTYRH